MEACAAVENELERILSKFTAIGEHSDRVIKDVMLNIEEIKRILSDGPENAELTANQTGILRDMLTKIRDKIHLVTTDHRDLHSNVSKVGKAIDRNFVSDFVAINRSDIFANEKNVKILNKIIAQHYYRQGMNDVGDVLLKESGDLSLDDINAEQYAELHKIWESIHMKNLNPALEWASEHSSELEQKHSSLEFKLHRLAFMQILSNGVHSQTEAIAYARNNFKKFVYNHEKEIQTLMGTLMYLPMGINNSPYRYLIAPEIWVEAADVFLKDACNILGINKDSHLAVVVNAGCKALPALLNLKQVMLSRQVLGIWNGRDELPIEIDLDAENRYHSIFACPILKQQSTDENPPMRLTCGHVISRDALHKLPNGHIVKCPYCPVEQSPSEAKLIYF